MEVAEAAVDDGWTGGTVDPAADATVAGDVRRETGADVSFSTVIFSCSDSCALCFAPRAWLSSPLNSALFRRFCSSCLSTWWRCSRCRYASLTLALLFLCPSLSASLAALAASALLSRSLLSSTLSGLPEDGVMRGMLVDGPRECTGCMRGLGCLPPAPASSDCFSALRQKFILSLTEVGRCELMSATGDESSSESSADVLDSERR